MILANIYKKKYLCRQKKHKKASMVERSNTTDSKSVLSGIMCSNHITCIAYMAERSKATDLNSVSQDNLRFESEYMHRASGI